jgi:hypothetical protein
MKDDLNAFNREDAAKERMISKDLCTKAVVVSMLTMEDIPDNLKECQKNLIQMRRLLAGALSSHLVCHARLEIAQEAAQKGQLSDILKQCAET